MSSIFTAGGRYGDKKKTLVRLAEEIERLPEAIRSRLTLENDDRVLYARRTAAVVQQVESAPGL